MLKICIVENFREFVDKFLLNEEDLIITTEFLYEKYLKSLSKNAKVVFQDKFGLGEPIDETIEKIEIKSNLKKKRL